MGIKKPTANPAPTQEKLTVNARQTLGLSCKRIDEALDGFLCLIYLLKDGQDDIRMNGPAFGELLQAIADKFSDALKDLMEIEQALPANLSIEAEAAAPKAA